MPSGVGNHPARRADSRAWPSITNHSTCTGSVSNSWSSPSNVAEALPKGRSHLADRLTRASLSVDLNVAEGADKFSKGENGGRDNLAARGSATESAALLDVYLRLELTSEVEHRPGKQMLERIVAMLVKLARSFEGP